MKRIPPGVALSLLLLMSGGVATGLADESLRAELAKLPYRIAFETYREGNWEIYTVRADGSALANLTHTPETHELYPHASRDGRKLCFVSDEGNGDRRRRNVYWMNLDGRGRTRVAIGGRDPCWTADGRGIIYLKDESERFAPLDYATKGVAIYDVASARSTEHPNRDLHHLYNICATPDGRWFIATVHAGMGFRHAILAIEAQGPRVVNLKIPGCRPDVSPDGRQIAWGASDYALRIGRLDFSGPEPRVIEPRDVVTSEKPIEVYHVDWSPDGRYVVFSRGPHHKSLGLAPPIVGVQAPGWDLWVADVQATNRSFQITTDGHSNKEPHWIPLPAHRP